MSTYLEDSTLFQSASIEKALGKIDANSLGVVFATDQTGRIVGCVTDGDIRRQLLINNDLGIAISTFMNRDFVSAAKNAPREHVLKLLDHRVRVLPLLDEHGQLVGLCTRDNFLLQEDSETYARARAPARISFGGGGSDLTHYFFGQGGMVVSATITRYAHALLRRRGDSSIRIYSHDLKETVEADSLENLKLDGHLDLIKAVARIISPQYGFELEVSTDFPIGSGLGGSATLAVAIIGCFNEFRSDPWTRHQIAEMAFQSERLHLNIPGGWQDQYAAAFGGFNFMEFSADENLIIPLRLEPRVLRELEASTILCYTKRNHNSGLIHADQKKKVASSSVAQAALQHQKDMTIEMRRCLLRGDVHGYGKLLHSTWQSKRQMSDLISDPSIEQIYDCAIANGALGGKILGAGGGGYFMFFAPHFERYRVCRALSELGYDSERIAFDEGGLVSWKTRMPEPA